MIFSKLKVHDVFVSRPDNTVSLENLDTLRLCLYFADYVLMIQRPDSAPLPFALPAHMSVTDSH